MGGKGSLPVLDRLSRTLPGRPARRGARPGCSCPPTGRRSHTAPVRASSCLHVRFDNLLIVQSLRAAACARSVASAGAPGTRAVHLRVVRRHYPLGAVRAPPGRSSKTGPASTPQDPWPTATLRWVGRCHGGRRTGPPCGRRDARYQGGRDECHTWQCPCMVGATGGAYPSIVELKDGSILVVYYSLESNAGSSVRARRFRLTHEGISSRSGRTRWRRYPAWPRPPVRPARPRRRRRRRPRGCNRLRLRCA